MDEVKRLRRSRTDKVIAGVCGGVGQYFNIDPVIIRILWLLSFFGAGAGLLAYIVAWLVIPEEDSAVE